jgi:tetratricopeptide (TPR) repeat protein
VRSIAELHAQRKDFDRALEYYARLTSVEAADPSLERAIAETHVKKFDHLLSQLDPQSADYAEQEAGLKAEKQRFVLADCRRRVERYPNDLQQRFEMGQICYEAGLLSEAIQEFQKAQNNPHRRIQSLYYLGLCFGAKGMHDLAARSFQTAIREKTVFDDEKKELIYSLGCAFEKMGRQEEAVEQLKLIYEADIGYRDVGAKVDAYYASKQQG